MAQRASNIHACVFVNTSHTNLFVYDTNGIIVDVLTENLTQEESRVFAAVQDAFNLAVTKHGAFQYDLFVCPLNFGDNLPVTAQNGLHVLPAALIESEYPDGTKKRYALGKDLDDKFFGSNWKAEDVYPYIKVLLLNETPRDNDTSLLCKMFPPLCSVGGWVWLALASGATFRAYDQRSTLWGAGAAFLWKEWYDRGGLEQIKQLASK